MASGISSALACSAREGVEI